MENLSLGEWLSIGGLFTTLVSVAVNVFQFVYGRKQRNELNDRLYTGLNAGYQSLWRIAQICDEARAGEQKDSDSFRPMLHIQQITGHADDGRAMMNAFSEGFIGRPLFYRPAWDVQAEVIRQKNQAEG